MREAVRSGRRANFYITENSFIDHYAREVGTTGIAVYHALARHANCETRSTWIGTAKVAELLGVEQRTVQRALKKLESLNLIRIIRSSNMTTYFLVPVPTRPRTLSVIPLFDQILDHEFIDENIGAEEDAASMSSIASSTSHHATSASFPASPVSFPTTSTSQTTTAKSHSRDIRDAAYKEEQDLENKTFEQENGISPDLKESMRFIVNFLKLPILKLPVTDSNRRTTEQAIEAALVTESEYSGRSFQDAAKVIAEAAIRDRDRGVRVNHFYFLDAPWRQSRGQNGRLNRAEQRKLDNLEVNARVKQRFRDILGSP
jgi:DNA-binding transcriptional ArsR family regulator